MKLRDANLQVKETNFFTNRLSCILPSFSKNASRLLLPKRLLKVCEQNFFQKKRAKSVTCHLPVELPQQTFVDLQDVLKTSSRHVLKTSSTSLQRNNFTSSKTSSRRFARCLQGVFKTSSRRICKTSSRRLVRRKIVTLKTC